MNDTQYLILTLEMQTSVKCPDFLDRDSFGDNILLLLCGKILANLSRNNLLSAQPASPDSHRYPAEISNKARDTIFFVKSNELAVSTGLKKSFQLSWSDLI